MEEDHSRSGKSRRSGKPVPRAVLVDLEPTVVDRCAHWHVPAALPPRAADLGKSSSSANKFARGHYTIGISYFGLERTRNWTGSAPGTPSWSTLRLRQECTQHQHSVVEHIAPAPRVCAAPALRRGVHRACVGSVHSARARDGLRCSCARKKPSTL